ncbi:hypothetical protein N7468_003532 [Penicillium chermesinum]|uniref:Cell wall protein n=1 Tax=Penicillium chermesinum TaxID=63820 RepID=A0A9W9TSC4_9EURO|nr:uncharacterized protein N7468_003532 [Penicillium chermesinum]KAJ5238913.1 hypothetical protein N7468_003532 [Penicillium chermesinum]KAJ6164553.1 hypothetical protein N7470_003225 [Penicillium chermesinum]
MSPNAFSLSSALCLFLALGPAAVLSAPQLGGLPILGGDNTDPAPTTGDSEHDAGAGIAVGIPGGPGVVLGAGDHSQQHGPCGPGVNSQHDSGAGILVGIPGGPGVALGAGTHDQHNAYPCPEPEIVATPVPVVVVPGASTTTQAPAVPVVTAAPPPVVPPPVAPAPVVPAPVVPAPVVPAPVAPAPVAPAPMVPSQVVSPPTWTTPIVIPTTTAPAYMAPSVVPVHSTPLIPRPGPSTTPSIPSGIPAYNAGSAISPSSSLLALALPIVLGLFY